MEINVERTKLIIILKQNAAIHQQEFEELKDAYLKKATVQATVMATAFSNGDMNFERHITAVKPVDYSADYATVIGMLELSSDNEFKLSEKDYKKYVLNEWEWSNSVAMTKAAYGLY